MHKSIFLRKKDEKDEIKKSIEFYSSNHFFDFFAFSSIKSNFLKPAHLFNSGKSPYNSN